MKTLIGVKTHSYTLNNKGLCCSRFNTGERPRAKPYNFHNTSEYQRRKCPHRPMPPRLKRMYDWDVNRHWWTYAGTATDSLVDSTKSARNDKEHDLLGS